MKKLISILVSVLTLISLCVLPANANYNDSLENELYSDCAILICTDNSEIIFEKNINKQTSPASLTKIITATVVLNSITDLNQQVTIPESCIRELDGTGSSMSGLKVGETVTVYDLLCCLLIPSANDAATTLANLVTGDDRQAFIDKMNALAEELGCTNSHFTNCHGLDDEEHYTTAADMVKFLENAMKNSTFAEIVSMTSYKIPETNMSKERTINTTNYTLLKGYKDYYCPYSNGGKTGSTSVAGHCLCSSASNDGYNYIAVCLNAPMQNIDDDSAEENCAFIDTKAMYDWAFDNLRLVSIAENTRIVGEVPVKYGKGADFVTLSPENTSFGLMPKGIDSGSLMIQIDEDTLPDKITAPIKKGEIICKGEVLYADRVIATVDLVANSDIKRGFFATIGGFAADLFSSAAVKIIATAILLVFAFLLISVLKSKNRKSKKKNGKGKGKVLKYDNYPKKK